MVDNGQAVLFHLGQVLRPTETGQHAPYLETHTSAEVEWLLKPGTVDVDVYDPASDTWTTGPPLPRALPFGRASKLDGEVHVVSHDATFAHREGAWAEVGTGAADEGDARVAAIAAGPDDELVFPCESLRLG